MNREVLDKFWERGILALVLAILIFGPLAMGAADAWAFLVVKGLMLGVMLGPRSAHAAEANLLNNGDFARGSGTSCDGWRVDAWILSPTATEFAAAPAFIWQLLHDILPGARRGGLMSKNMDAITIAPSTATPPEWLPINIARPRGGTCRRPKASTAPDQGANSSLS